MYGLRVDQKMMQKYLKFNLHGEEDKHMLGSGCDATSDGDALALHAVDEADGVVGVADGAEHVLAAAPDHPPAAAATAAANGLLRHDAGLHPGGGGGRARR